MQIKKLRNLFALLGIIGGLALAFYVVLPMTAIFGQPWVPAAVLTGLPLLLGLIAYLAAPAVFTRIVQSTDWLVTRLIRAPIQEVLVGAVGLILGLTIAALLAGSLSAIPVAGTVLPSLAAVLFGYLGWTVAVNKRDDLFGLIQGLRLPGKVTGTGGGG
ncbi:MAG: hypothetical protein WD535_05625, partial [Thermaerobacterales bacterium]